MVNKEVLYEGEEILKALRISKHGLTITDIVDELYFTRSNTRILLAILEGQNKVEFRKVGMAKIYTVTE